MLAGRGWACGAVMAGLGLVAGEQSAAGQYNKWETEIGYEALADEAVDLPMGAGVAVTIVESAGGGAYRPQVFGPDGVTLTDEFAGKTITFRSGEPVGYSAHATVVSRLYFGSRVTSVRNQRSLAPGVTDIDVYSTAWLGSGYLRKASDQPPPVSPNRSRVASHAYLASTQFNQIVRLDYLVALDDYVQIVAATGGAGDVAGLGVSYNAIAIGHAQGRDTPHGTVELVHYPAGRHKPDLHVTHTISDSIGITAGAAAMLIGLGADPALSRGHVVSPRTSITLQHAQTAAVIKAVLMAGAAREVAEAPWSEHPITTYRTAPEHRTANGLDTRYGAGRLHIQHSYRILSAGEQDAPGYIEAYGFDYAPTFGGEDDRDHVATYRFATVAEGGRLTATLAWNVPVTFDAEGSFDLTARPQFAPLTLTLVDVTDGGAVEVATSASPIDNTQSLWEPLPGGRAYALQVRCAAGHATQQGYALAWRIDGWRDAASSGSHSIMDKHAAPNPVE
jgi:hypothetical protein